MNGICLCGTCGSLRFWEANDGGVIAFSMGARESNTLLGLDKQIFAADCGDLYNINDGVPQC